QFQALYGQYQPVIYKCMKKYYLNDYDTENWLQEGRIVFFRTLERFDSEKQASLEKFFKPNFENHVHSLIRQQSTYK
ncbi:sigma factor, partial [Enterococcus faecalis]|uniref:sigma factor n=1 Tax=Enterococcus faecalis TaxID=1351 RepID=UPI003D6BBC7C